MYRETLVLLIVTYESEEQSYTDLFWLMCNLYKLASEDRARTWIKLGLQ